MEDKHFVIGEIISKFPELNQDERVILDNWLELENNRDLFRLIREDLEKNPQSALFRIEELKKDNEQTWAKFQNEIGAVKNTRQIGWWSIQRMLAAASIIFVLIISTFLWYLNKPGKDSMTTVSVNKVFNASDTIVAEGFKAKLILSDGSSIVLDSTNTGKLVEQGNISIVNKDGALTYVVNSSGTPKDGRNDSKIMYNTLQTAAGQTFATELSDGTKIWLNSGSSLQYPVIFSGSERRVLITGEAYFEVAKLEKPFIVANVASPLHEPAWAIHVLGTHFNINAYVDEESINATLLEGKIRMVLPNDEIILKPGQQARLNRSKATLTTLNNINVDQVIAWKNGFFQFSNESIETVMKKVSRWYGMEIVYNTAVSKEKFGGRLSRSSTLSEVLDALKEYGLRFNVQGRKIYVN